jgi:hypothetical protein
VNTNGRVPAAVSNDSHMNIPPDAVCDHDFVTGPGFQDACGQRSRPIHMQDIAAGRRQASSDNEGRQQQEANES